MSPAPPGLSRPFRFLAVTLCEVLQPRTCRNTSGLGSVRFDRHYSGHRCFFLFLQVLRCFSSLRSLRLLDGASPSDWRVSPISGSIPVCSSPELFAAFHVLLRLLKPRHPPYALICFLCLSRLEIVSFRPLLLPRYLFPILSMNFHRISSMIFAASGAARRIF